MLVGGIEARRGLVEEEGTKPRTVPDLRCDARGLHTLTFAPREREIRSIFVAARICRDHRKLHNRVVVSCLPAVEVRRAPEEDNLVARERKGQLGRLRKHRSLYRLLADGPVGERAARHPDLALCRDELAGESAKE